MSHRGSSGCEEMCGAIRTPDEPSWLVWCVEMEGDGDKHQTSHHGSSGVWRWRTGVCGMAGLV